MLWVMMRFYLLSIALVFCGYTNGFNVWNRTSILDWQAGRSNVTWSQNFQLATPGQLLELPSRKGPNGNDGRGNFGNPMLTSEVQPVQRDSSFVQSSGGVAQIKQILNAYGQTAPSYQPNDASQPSQLYWNEFIKPGNCGPLPSQHWPAKNLPGFQSPSSSQPAGTINQVSESWAQSPYQPNSTPVSADPMSSSLAQSSGALTWFQNASSSRYLTSQSIPSSQSVVTTNQISESQTQLPYQSSSTGTTISVSTSQSDSTAQPQGSNRTKSSETAKWYRVLQGKMIPSSSKVLGFQTQLYQPSSPTQFSAGQSASTVQAQGPSASTPFQGPALSWHVSQSTQSIPSSQAVVTTNPTQSSYQPSLPTQALAGQSAISQEQPLQASAAYPLQASGWYTISQGWKIPSSSQVSGFQAQSYQPGTATQVLFGQPASPVQSMGDSTLYQALTSGRYLASPGQSIPSSSQSVITTGQITDAQAQSSQPSPTMQALAGQSISQDQSLQASAAYPLQTSGWYTTSQGQKIPSSSQVSGFQAQSIQPSTTTQVLSGQSVAQDQSLQASNVSQTSGWYTILLGKMIPSSQVSGVQTGLLIPPSSTQGLPGPSASTAPLQPLDSSTQYQMQGSSRYISQNQSNPLSFQSVVTTNQISGIKSPTPYWANTTWTTASQSNSMSQGSYMTESSGNAKWYSVVQGQMMPSSSGLQVQSFQPSTATQVLTGQSVASPVQSMGDSKLYQALTSGRYLSSLGQNIPPTPQAVATTNQTSGFQNIYWPNTPVSTSQTIFLPQSSSASQLFQGQTSGMSSISQDQSIPSSSLSVDTSSQIAQSQTQSSLQPSTTTQILVGQSALSSQPIGASSLYQALTSGRYLASLGQSIPSSSQSVDTPSQSTPSQTQSSFQPSTTTQVLMGQSAIAQDTSLQASYPPQTSGWYTILQGQIPSPSQVSGFQAQSSYQPSSTTQVTPGQSVSSQSMGASALYQALTSGRYRTSLGQNIPPSPQPVATTNQISGFQNTYWSNTPVSTSQTISLPQSSSASQLFQGQTSGMSSISQDQSIPSSSQSVDTSSQIAQSQTQSSFQPSTTTQVLTGQSAPAQSLRNSPLCSSQTPSWYPTLQGKLIPSSQMSGFQTALQQPSTTSQSAASSQAQSMRDSPLYQGLTSYSNLTSQYQRTPSSFQSVAALNQISGIQNQSIYWPNTVQLAPSQSAFTSQSQSSGVTTMHQVPAKGLPNISQDQSITASLQSVPSTNQISGFQNQTSYWPSATQVLPGDSHIAQIQSLGNSVSYPSQTSGWYTFVQSKIPSSQVSGFQAPLYQPSTQILAGQSDSTALLSSSGPMLYQGQALSRYNISQDQSFPSSSLSVATTNQISGALSQSSFQPNSTVASASKSSTSQVQSSGASAWYQGPTFGFLTSQSQTIPSSSQAVVPANQFSRFQNLMFQSNAAQALSPSASTPQGAPQKIAGIPFQGSLPQLVSKKWPVTQ